MNGLITRLFCTECLSFCTVSYGCYVLGYLNELIYVSRFVMFFQAGKLN